MIIDNIFNQFKKKRNLLSTNIYSDLKLCNNSININYVQYYLLINIKYKKGYTRK